MNGYHLSNTDSSSSLSSKHTDSNSKTREAGNSTDRKKPEAISQSDFPIAKFSAMHVQPHQRQNFSKKSITVSNLEQTTTTPREDAYESTLEQSNLYTNRELPNDLEFSGFITVSNLDHLLEDRVPLEEMTILDQTVKFDNCDLGGMYNNLCDSALGNSFIINTSFRLKPQNLSGHQRNSSDELYRAQPGGLLVEMSPGPTPEMTTSALLEPLEGVSEIKQGQLANLEHLTGSPTPNDQVQCESVLQMAGLSPIRGQYPEVSKGNPLRSLEESTPARDIEGSKADLCQIDSGFFLENLESNRQLQTPIKAGFMRQCIVELSSSRKELRDKALLLGNIESEIGYFSDHQSKLQILIGKNQEQAETFAGNLNLLAVRVMEFWDSEKKRVSEKFQESFEKNCEFLGKNKTFVDKRLHEYILLKEAIILDIGSSQDTGYTDIKDC